MRGRGGATGSWGLWILFSFKGKAWVSMLIMHGIMQMERSFGGRKAVVTILLWHFVTPKAFPATSAPAPTLFSLLPVLPPQLQPPAVFLGGAH